MSTEFLIGCIVFYINVILLFIGVILYGIIVTICDELDLEDKIIKIITRFIERDRYERNRV